MLARGVRILGALEARIGSEVVALGGNRRQLVQAVLLEHAKEVVTTGPADRRRLGRGAARDGTQDPPGVRRAAPSGLQGARDLTMG
jgi:hypothetical protein